MQEGPDGLAEGVQEEEGTEEGPAFEANGRRAGGGEKQVAKLQCKGSSVYNTKQWDGTMPLLLPEMHGCYAFQLVHITLHTLKAHSVT